MPLAVLPDASEAVPDNSMAVVGNSTVLIFPDCILMVSPSMTSNTGVAVALVTGSGSHVSVAVMPALTWVPVPVTDTGWPDWSRNSS